MILRSINVKSILISLAAIFIINYFLTLLVIQQVRIVLQSSIINDFTWSHVVTISVYSRRAIVIQITALNSIIPCINFVALVWVFHAIILKCIVSGEVIFAWQRQISFYCYILVVQILSDVVERVLVAVFAQQVLLGNLFRNSILRVKCVIFSVAIDFCFRWSLIQIVIQHRLHLHIIFSLKRVQI